MKVCNGPVAESRDGRQDDRTHGVAEHVGVKAPTGETRAALANSHVTRRVAEGGGAGSRLLGARCSDAVKYADE